MTTIEKHISTYVEIDIDIDDVLEFIGEASDNEIEKLKSALKVDLYVTPTELDEDTIRYLINQANQFGLSDMLEQLKNEGVRVGAYLKPKESK